MRSRLIFVLRMVLIFTVMCVRTDVYAADDSVFYISADGKQIKVQMVDNAATRELKSMLAEGDLTISMTRNSFEQYGSLGKTLPAEDTSITAKAGDVLLYNSNILCIFYGSNSYSYTRIGKVQDLSNDEIKDILSDKNLTITLSKNSFGTVPNTGVASRNVSNRIMLYAGCIAAWSWALVISRKIRGGKIAKTQEK